MVDSGNTILTAIGEFFNRKTLINSFNLSDGTASSTQYKTTDTSLFRVYAMEAKGNSVFMLLGNGSSFRAAVLDWPTGTFSGRRRGYFVEFEKTATIGKVYGMRLSADSLVLAGSSGGDAEAWRMGVCGR